MAMKAELRGDGRRECDLHVTLTRAQGSGNPVPSRTRNIGAGGMCVATDRPLAIDELLAFRVETGADGPVEGSVRVLREHLPNVYALRFEEVSLESLARLERLA